jgi:hypothetical protein
VDAGVGVDVGVEVVVGAEAVVGAVVTFRGLRWAAGTCPTAPAGRSWKKAGLVPAPTYRQIAGIALHRPVVQIPVFGLCLTI